MLLFPVPCGEVFFRGNIRLDIQPPQFDDFRQHLVDGEGIELVEPLLRAVRDGFRHILDAHAVLAALHLVYGDLLAVTSEAVNLPENDNTELPFGRVLQHLLELGAVIRPTALCSVNVFMHDGVAVCGGVVSRVGELPFDGLFSLTVT